MKSDAPSSSHFTNVFILVGRPDVGVELLLAVLMKEE